MTTACGTFSPALISEKKVLNGPLLMPIPLFDRIYSSACLPIWPEAMLEALQLSRAVATLEIRMAGMNRRRLPHS
jgi:hypothetical protein